MERFRTFIYTPHAVNKRDCINHNVVDNIAQILYLMREILSVSLLYISETLDKYIKYC